MQKTEKLEALLNWLAEKQAENIKVYNVSESSAYTDFIVVCEGSADLHNKAIANHLLDMAKEAKYRILGRSGLEFGLWILLDIGDVIVHIFLPEKREFYQIDQHFADLAANKIKEKNDDKATLA